MSDHFSSRFVNWALANPAVHVLIQIGSRVRPAGSPTGADEYSDWDFQIVVSDAAALTTASAFAATGIGEPIAFTARTGRLGSIPKITALFPDGLLDVVLIPLDRVKALFAFGTHDRRAENRSARDLVEIALVYRGGYKFLKDTIDAERTVTALIAASPQPRLDDAAVVNLVHAFLCDAFAIRAQLHRGEFCAAQRFLHTQLAETNFALLQELMLRAGRPAFPDARRLETTAPTDWVQTVTIDAEPTSPSLAVAINQATSACLRLTRALLDASPLLPAVERAFSLAEERKN